MLTRRRVHPRLQQLAERLAPPIPETVPTTEADRIALRFPPKKKRVRKPKRKD